MGHPRQTATCCICGATFEGSVRYALVDRDRMDRLIEAGREYRAMLASQCGAYVGVTRNCTPVVTEDDVRYEWEASDT